MERAGSHPSWPAHRVFRQLLLLANTPPSMSRFGISPPHAFNFFIHNMLCFNYIANIIKLMGLLSREGMKGYVGTPDMWGYAGRVVGDT